MLTPSSDKQVFPSLEFIGWYTVGPRPTARHIALHEQVCRHPMHMPTRRTNYLLDKFTVYCSTPLLLVLQPSLSLAGGSDINAQSLPFKAYEPTVEIKERTSRSVYIEVPYNVETGEAERIAVDWTARGGGSGTSCELNLPFLRLIFDLVASGIPSEHTTICCEDVARTYSPPGEICHRCNGW